MSSTEKTRVVDSNSDGILTAAEHAAGSKRMFDIMDVNRDGQLSLEEIAASHHASLNKKNDGNH